MSDAVLVDNDVVLKTCRWLLGSPTRVVILRHGPPMILGSARFVLPHRLGRVQAGPHTDAAREELRTFLATASLVEPDEAAIQLAADFQEAAQEFNLPLESGESQLLAVLVTNGASILLTGDKRAIAAAEVVAASLNCCESAAGRLACLEQLVSSIVSEIGAEAVRVRVCADAEADRAVATCFSCWAASAVKDDANAGLASYIADLRSRAPNLLAAGNCLPSHLLEKDSERRPQPGH